MYSNIRQVTHDSYLPISMQQKLRRDYYSGITHVDNMIGLLLKYVEDKNLMENTNIILMADHGQNLGEFNMWSMMNLMETSLQIPLIIKPAASSIQKNVQNRKITNEQYNHPVELVDIFPTAVALAGLPKIPFYIPGIDLTKALYTTLGDSIDNNNNISTSILKKYAFSQISRCKN